MQDAVEKKLRFSNKKGKVETLLVDHFLYPKFGPGQFWEEVARKVRKLGGEIHMKTKVTRLVMRGDCVSSIEAIDEKTDEVKSWNCDFVMSSMPVKNLTISLGKYVPADLKRVARGLPYRDFITVGLLVKQLKTVGEGRGLGKDNWVYIQEPSVKMGRFQIFNNWSPYMVKDRENIWLGLEYFCDEGDELWCLSDVGMSNFAIRELIGLGIINGDDVLDSTVVKMPKAYPAYFGSYNKYGELRSFLDKITNLYLIGRNGMHRYNNQDHSMLTAMVVVDNIVSGRKDKSNIWDVNTESEYHEAK